MWTHGQSKFILSDYIWLRKRIGGLNKNHLNPMAGTRRKFAISDETLIYHKMAEIC